MSWIWLSDKKYNDKQNTKGSAFNASTLNYCVATFKKEFVFNKEIKSVKLKFAVDTTGYLLLDNKIVFNDNAKTNGDFVIRKETINEIYYLEDTVNFESNKKSFEIKAFAQLGATRYYDFSSGQAGLFIEGEVLFTDGTKEAIETDTTWIARLEKSYVEPYKFDNTVDQEEESKPVIVKGNWILLNSEIKNPIEEEINYDNKFVINAHSKKTYYVDLPKCYSTHYEIEVIGNSLINATLLSKELRNVDSHTHYFKTNKSCKFRFFDLISCGGFKLSVNNKGDKDVTIIIHVLHSHYPFNRYNKIETDNIKLNDLFEKCAFAVKNCSQSILLDSPKHCEPASSCSGDYNIISLSNAFLTGEYELAKHNLKEYAKLLEITNGVNANSSYALLFIKWLRNIYMLTGDKSLIEACQLGMKNALDLYTSFIGESGLIEKSYNYIFIDWLNIDGVNMFAPPKNLGQSVVTINFYDALMCGSYLYSEINNDKLAKKYKSIANKLKKAINTLLFDKEKGLYIEGLTTKDEEQPLKTNKPDVTDKIYYRKHANIVAVASGLQNKSMSRKIVNKIFNDPLIKDLEVQPYFDHYLFEAIHKADLDKKYALKLLREFIKFIKIKDKGLPEGFYKPHPGYVFDFSHAWVCTPYYSFIVATLGLDIVKPGIKEIKIKPLIGKLNYKYTIPTQFGDITVNKKDKDFSINVPKEINVLQ